MRRRTVIGLGLLGMGGVAYGYRDKIDLGPVASTLETQQSLDGDLSRMEWSEDESTLSVWFEEDHSSDFLAVVHEADDETVLWSAEAPRFAGPLEVPMLDAVACDAGDYPSRVFELVAGTGTVSFGMVQDIKARQPVELSTEWMQRARQHDPDRLRCLSLKN